MTTWQDTPPVIEKLRWRIENDSGVSLGVESGKELLALISGLDTQLALRDSELASLRSQLANKEME